MKVKPANVCAVCGHQAVSASEHAIHATLEHPELNRNVRGDGTAAPRPVSCWRCASLIPTKDDNRTCPNCGWEHPGFVTQHAVEYVAEAFNVDVEELQRATATALDHRGRRRERRG